MLHYHWFQADQSRPHRRLPGPKGRISSQRPLAGKRVVVVEDEGITQIQLRMILNRAGMQVAGAAVNGEEAVAIVLRERPDIVIMDIKMPGSFDGLEATRRILAEFRTCVVMLTAYSNQESTAQAVGASGFISKPIDSVTLLPQLETAYRRFIDIQ